MDHLDTKHTVAQTAVQHVAQSLAQPLARPLHTLQDNAPETIVIDKSLVKKDFNVQIICNLEDKKVTTEEFAYELYAAKNSKALNMIRGNPSLKLFYGVFAMIYPPTNVWQHSPDDYDYTKTKDDATIVVLPLDNKTSSIIIDLSALAETHVPYTDELKQDKTGDHWPRGFKWRIDCITSFEKYVFVLVKCIFTVKNTAYTKAQGILKFAAQDFKFIGCVDLKGRQAEHYDTTSIYQVVKDDMSIHKIQALNDECLVIRRANKDLQLISDTGALFVDNTSDCIDFATRDSKLFVVFKDCVKIFDM